MVSQAVDVGGSFGANWIATTGNKEIFSPNATGLWSWGQIPLGNVVEGGKLVSTGHAGDTTLILPAFAQGQSSSSSLSNLLMGASGLQNLIATPNALNGQLPHLTIGNYVDNKTLNQAQNIPHGLDKQQLSSPYLSEDPWAVAQETGQLILTHSDY